MFKLKSETIEINGETFEVREAPAGVVYKIMGKLAEDPEAQRALVMHSVYYNGAPIGDNFDLIGGSAYMPLLTKAMEMIQPPGGLGND